MTWSTWTHPHLRPAVVQRWHPPNLGHSEQEFVDIGHEPLCGTCYLAHSQEICCGCGAKNCLGLIAMPLYFAQTHRYGYAYIYTYIYNMVTPPQWSTFVTPDFVLFFLEGRCCFKKNLEKTKRTKNDNLLRGPHGEPPAKKNRKEQTKDLACKPPTS